MKQVEGSFNQVPETRASHLAGGFWLWSGMERDGLRNRSCGAPTVPGTMGWIDLSYLAIHTERER